MLAPPPPAEARSGGVLVVGDSLEVGTGPYLQGELPGTPITVDAVEGRTSGEILSALRSRIATDPAVVVFDAGTNDDPASPGTLAANLEAAGRLAGSRCMVVATINRPPYNGYGPEGLNAAIGSFAATRPGTVVVDWQAAAQANPGLINPDGVHPTAAGYSLRARVIAEGIRGCLGGDSTAPTTPTADVPQETPEPSRPNPARTRAQTAFLVVSESLSGLRTQVASLGPAAFAPLLLAYVLGLP